MPRTNNSLFGLRRSLFCYHNSQSTSMSLLLSSMSELLWCCLLDIRQCNISKWVGSREASRACWMDARRSCPAWQGWPMFMFIITWTVSTPRHVEWRESRSMFCETKHVLKFKQIVKKAWRYNTEKYNNQTMKFTHSAIRPTLFCCEFVCTIHVRSVM